MTITVCYHKYMKTIFRYFLINFIALWATTEIVKGLTYSGGIKTLLVGTVAFAVINFLLVPLLKILLLPLNLLTLGLFAWVTNVLALYALTKFVSEFMLLPYNYPGFVVNGFIFPAVYLNPLWVAIAASFSIGIIAHFTHWLMH